MLREPRTVCLWEAGAGRDGHEPHACASSPARSGMIPGTGTARAVLRISSAAAECSSAVRAIARSSEWG